MKGMGHDLIRRLVVETRGAEIAETAAVLPVMFTILLGIFWFGQAFSIYGAITRAAQEGARAGSAPYCATCNPASTTLQSVTNAANATQAALISSQLDPTKVRYPIPAPALLSCSSGGAVSCTSGGNSNNFCVQAPIQLTGTGSSGLCGISVSFQYPFQFWLPFTSLNNQSIWIAASARVRMENR